MARGQNSVNEAYATLGLEEGASLEQVKTTYKQLALKTHPDKNPDNPEATERFQELGAAYALLQKHLDPAYEEAFDDDYDSDMDDDDEVPLGFYFYLFEEIFNGRSGMGRGRRPPVFVFSRSPRARSKEESEAEYQARLKREREERAAAEKRRIQEEAARRKKYEEMRQKDMKDAEARRKAKADDKKAAQEAAKMDAARKVKEQHDRSQALRSKVFAAARGGKIDFVKKAIWEMGVDAAGGEFTAEKGDQDTLFHIAIKLDSLDLVKWLDAHNAEPEECNKKGLGPFAFAVQEGRVAIMKYFMETYPPEERESQPVLRGTPEKSTNLLELALRSRIPEAVWLILENKLTNQDETKSSWLFLHSTEGKTALGLRDNNDLFEELRDLLLEYGSNIVANLPLPREQKHSPKSYSTTTSSTASSDVHSSPSTSHKASLESEETPASAKPPSRGRGLGRGKGGRGRQVNKNAQQSRR